MRLFAVVLTVLSSVVLSQAATNTVLCYYESWAADNDGNGKFTPAQIPAKACTHLVYSFILPGDNGKIKAFNDGATLRQLVGLKSQNPGLKVTAAIGGWSAGSVGFSNIARNAGQRANLVQALSDFVGQYQLDGVDIDWEYPGNQGGDASVDKINYVQFLRELRAKLGPNKVITAAVGADLGLLSSAYDVKAMNEQLTFINLMTYDYHGSDDGRTGQNAPLYASSVDSDKNVNADSTVKAWIAAGASASKLLLGLGFYGHSFKLANNGQNGLGAKTAGAGQKGPYTDESGYAAYSEICTWLKQGGWNTVYDQQQQSVFSYKGNQWIGYDNVQSITVKSQYAVSKGLGGVMMWAIDNDDAYNVCGGGSMPLLSAINRVIQH